MKYIIIGTGNICRTYIRAINNLENSEIVGFISRSGNHPEGAPDLPVWKDLNSVTVPFDTVIITTPNGLHCESAVAAAALGKHVLTEKPLDINRPNMEKMIKACREAGVTLSVAFQRRMSPDNLALKILMEEGKLGRIYSVDLSCKFWRSQEYYDSAPYRGNYEIDGGGPFIQQAVHNLDTYQWLFGMPDKVVSMVDTFRHEMEAEDHGAALMRHGNGMIGTIVASTAAEPGFPARMEVSSDKGYFITVDDKITEWHIRGVENPASKPGESVAESGNSPAISDSSRHEAVIRDLEVAVNLGRDPLITGESAARTTELVLEIYEGNVR